MFFSRKKKIEKPNNNLDLFLKGKLQDDEPAITKPDEQPATKKEEKEEQKNEPTPIKSTIVNDNNDQIKKDINYADSKHQEKVSRPREFVNNQKNFGNPKILDLDLVKRESEGMVDFRHYFNLMISALCLALFVVGQVYLIISFWEKQESNRDDLSLKLLALDNETKKFQKTADEAMAFKARAERVTPLLGKHIYWSNFFNYLEKNTLSSVSFGGFEGNINGDYSLIGTAQRYSDINWQVKKILTDDYTISASVNEGKIETTSGAAGADKDKLAESQKKTAAQKAGEVAPGAVNFELALKIKPDLFYAAK